MNSFCVLLLLASTALAFDIYDIMPCAFELMTYTRVLSGGAVLTTSKDAIYHDHNELWRWDSEFEGMPGFFEGHEWSVIWRDDDGVSYHDNLLEGTCQKWSMKNTPKNPYEWVMSKTDGVTWSKEDCDYDGEPATKYVAKTTSKQYKFTAVMNLYQIKKTGVFASGNGTVEGSLVDVTFEIEVNKYSHNSPLPGSLFMTSAPCPLTVEPEGPSRDFQQYCYARSNPSESSSSAVVIKPSFLFFLATLLAALLIFVAV